jgi:hypothetical protein
MHRMLIGLVAVVWFANCSSGSSATAGRGGAGGGSDNGTDGNGYPAGDGCSCSSPRITDPRQLGCAPTYSGQLTDPALAAASCGPDGASYRAGACGSYWVWKVNGIYGTSRSCVYDGAGQLVFGDVVGEGTLCDLRCNSQSAGMSVDLSACRPAELPRACRLDGGP